MIKPTWQLDLGANSTPEEKMTFKVWAPRHLTLCVQIEEKQTYAMNRDEQGMFTLTSENVHVGDHYFYIMENGLMRPDPVSRSLPHGVHGPTEIIDPYSFKWSDQQWKGIHLSEAIFYEMHVGTFTPRGTFDGVCEQLDYLKELGINCIEIMPLAQFSGRFNWGYDGTSPYAPFDGYGGVEGFKQFVNACHQLEIAVCLDVVYNHLGPEGNYLEEFAPYFSEIYHTPWGKAFNYDGAYSDYVREYIIKNALHWIIEYHVDMLRLDAIHGIYDFSAKSMLEELVETVNEISKQLDRSVYVVAEADNNDTRAIRAKQFGGWGISAMWNDDFHHAVHVALTGEQDLYYRDFNGLSDVATSLSNRFVYEGKYSIFRKKRHGNHSSDLPSERFIVFAQNHDQVGNRFLGERLSMLVNKERLKIAACFTVLSPSIPLFFMGEEYGELAPFDYFIDYEDERLIRSVYEGRKKEFQKETLPFPGKEAFEHSHLTWKCDQELLLFYKQLIAIRKKHLPKQGITGADLNVYYVEENWLGWEYPTHTGEWIGVLINLGKEKELPLPLQKVKGTSLLASEKLKMGKIWQLPSDSYIVLI